MFKVCVTIALVAAVASLLLNYQPVYQFVDSLTGGKLSDERGLPTGFATLLHSVAVGVVMYIALLQLGKSLAGQSM